MTICMADMYRGATAMQRTVLIQSLSVRLSVKRVDCDKTKGTCAHILISTII